MKDYTQLQRQVKAAWAKLPKDLQSRLEPRILAAHEYALGIRNKTLVPSATPPPHQLLMVYSMLHDDRDALLRNGAGETEKGLLTSVGPEGEIYFGGVDYDATDPGWTYIIVALAETLNDTPPFKLPTSDAAIKIPDDATLAILGDWGGGNTPAQQVAASAKADYMIHAGDVYYAGTNGSDILEPYESDHFLDVWPGADGKSFALNSNHDMYAHATGYSGTTLAPGTVFKAQKSANAFALCNGSFRIVGLDSAYYAPDVPLYDVGSLGREQANFLQRQAKLASDAGQDLIILTHHNGLSADGSTTEPLWQEVTNQLYALKGKSVSWYWGHVHVGAVYKPQTVNGVTINPRCCGHSCIPWGVASGLRNKNNVLWFEKEVLGPKSNYFVTNGYATLALSRDWMTETFHDQSGKATWTTTRPKAAKAA